MFVEDFLGSKGLLDDSVALWPYSTKLVVT